MRSHAPQPQTQITKAATADPHIMHRGPPEAHNTNAMRRASNERPIRTQCKGDLQLPSARKGRGWICGPESPASTASGCSRDHNPTKKRLAEAETPTPLEARNHSQVVVLASIDLRSQHGRLVSARFSASVRIKGRSGLMQQGRKSSGGQGLPDRAAEEQATTRGERGFERASRADFF